MASCFLRRREPQLQSQEAHKITSLMAPLSLTSDWARWCNWIKNNWEKFSWRASRKVLPCWSRITKEKQPFSCGCIWAKCTNCHSHPSTRSGAGRWTGQSLTVRRQKNGKSLTLGMSLSPWFNLRSVLSPHLLWSDIINFLYSVRQLSQAFLLFEPKTS